MAHFYGIVKRRAKTKEISHESMRGGEFENG